MPVDTHFIRRKIKLIQEDLSELDHLAHHSFEEITKDRIKFLGQGVFYDLHERNQSIF